VPPDERSDPQAPPLLRPAPPEEPALPAAAERPAPAAARPCRILLVEDNALLQALYERALRRLDAPGGPVELALEHAHDGVEALARLRGSPPVGLVVTDLYMPVMDGFSLVEQLRSDPALAATPIVAISAGGAEARARALELGVDVYLGKPLRTEELLQAVRALLGVAP
jgi:CheY-like chemotaxis protein